MNDLATIVELHNAARQLQTEKKMVVWPIFPAQLLEQDIIEQRQFKLIQDNQIACTWTITWSDKEIWGEMDHDNAVYLHRIATNPAYRGKRFIDQIVESTANLCRASGREYIRLDTLGYNAKLIEHYTSAGFTFLGVTRLADVSNLPEHYHREPDCLRFEMKIPAYL